MEKIGQLSRKVEWSGEYHQGGKGHPMQFDHLEIDDNKVHGHGSDSVGAFTINGSITWDGSISFVKQYTGKHAVNYEGKVHGHTISGQWSIGATKDKFEIQMKVKQWKGHYSQGGKKHDMALDLNLNNGKLLLAPLSDSSLLLSRLPLWTRV